MMFGIKIFLMSVATLHVTVQGRQAVTERTEDVHYDTVYISHDGPVSRSKRSTQMPHTMFFDIKSHKTDIKLRLKRAPKLDIPTYMLTNGTVERVYIPDYQKHGVYISYDTGKAVMVSEKGGYYDVEGEVVVNNQNLQVTSLGGGRHNLFAVGPISYGKDYRNADKSNNLKPKISVRKAARRLRKGRRNRSKRQVTQYVTELLIITDTSVRNKFIARNGDLAIADAELKTYYALIILGMTERYQSISLFYPDVSYVVEGSGIVIPATINDVPFYRDNQNNGLVQFDPALDAFTDWVNLNKDTLPKHDHAMWFTNDQLASGTSTSVIGVAWLNGVCRNLGTSIVEDFYSGGTTSTATHELGHSLAAYHDGDFRECSNNDYYVMAAFAFIPIGTQGSNPWFFSYCSSVYIVYYTEQTNQCLTTDDNGITSPSTTEVAGQYIDADEQCRLAFSSSSSYFCRNRQRTELGFPSMCNRLYCYNPQNADCEYIGSMDFTSCGSGQWCEKGECVAAASAPQTAMCITYVISMCAMFSITAPLLKIRM
ncbi:hypothetical protein LOTGIDRAFT_175259 [Lottia gigantea]|uniref:Peptidase M12B domain-containing protein n=1 Tax=Lottia gigantea TaxID=225164 RepID=V4ADM1_LOTGI|nr:hypothetical protein LOTGIDRAFT_175259 [Lottia gigantea]ESO94947.1 hypothetical protein LOTGIDRAFT_175259 [Lottia gigantea]